MRPLPPTTADFDAPQHSGLLQLAEGDIALDASLTVLTPPNTQPADPPPTTSGNYDLLVSLGGGDLRLLRLRNHVVQWATPVVWPLRPAPPLAGVRPFQLEAAYTAANGEVGRCVVVCWGDGVGWGG